MKCDLHCHTYYSYDSNASVKEVVDQAIRRKIDCLAITDHGEIRGALEARRYAEGRILVLTGIELRTKEGDILGLGVRERIPNGLSAEETVRLILDAGGLPVIAHPFSWPFHFRQVEEFIRQNRIAVEILNGSSLSYFNKKAQRLVQTYNLPFTAGSDAHLPEEVGRVYWKIPGKRLGIREILEAIRARRGVVGGQEVNLLQKMAIFLKQGKEIFRTKKTFCLFSEDN